MSRKADFGRDPQSIVLQTAGVGPLLSSGDASPGLSLAFVHEDLPGRAPASSATVTTAACFGMRMSMPSARSSVLPPKVRHTLEYTQK